MGWLLHCNTGSLRKHKPSVPCSVLLLKKYVIVKACSRNISGSTNLMYSKKTNLPVQVRLSFQGLPSFLGKEKSVKCTYFATGHCFIHPPLISTTLLLVFAWASLAKVCEYSALLNVLKDSLLIVRVILLRWSIKTFILSDLRRQWFLCWRFLRR